MSTEGNSQPPAGSDKPRAPKGPITTSAFINKGGKTFAPKAVRRRPGAAAAAAKPKPPEPAAPTAESQPAPTQTSEQTDATPAPQPQTEAQLPTPVATQDAAPQIAQQSEQTVAEPATSPAEPIAPTVDTTPTPVPTPSDEDIARHVDKAIEDVLLQPSADSVAAKRPAEDELQSRQPSKQRRIETQKEARETQPQLHAAPSVAVPAVQSAPITEPTPTEPEDADAPIPEQPSNDAAHAPTSEPTTATEALEEVAGAAQEGDNAGIQADEVQAPAALTRPKRRRLPWTAVNTPRNEDDGPTPTSTTSKTKPRRRRKAITLREMDEEDAEEAQREEDAQARPKRPSAKARGKRKASETAADDGTEDPAQPVKKARKPRKAKGKKRAVVEGEEGNEDGEADDGEESRPKKKRRKKQNAEQTDDANEGDEGDEDEEGEEGEQQPKRRGRKPREPTPSDAEDEEIDTGVTLMRNIASSNIRVGKLSEREKKMRTINWDEVKQRRREKQMTRSRKDLQAEADRRLEEQREAAEPAEDPHRLQFTMVDGVITQVAGSGIIDHEAQAEREREAMVVVDEDDFTHQMTYRSYMSSNKRYPEDFIVSGQGKRWDFKSTEDFYEALSIFGTDFAMIQTLFPGTKRQSIKHKFTKEERNNPTRIKETLLGALNCDWDQFLEVSGRKDESFADVDRIERELREEREQMEVLIQRAKEAAEEEKRQRRAAGVESEDEAAAGEKDKENEKGRKKKGKRVEKEEKQVAFQLAPDEECLGSVDDDDDWGKE
ncbi:hypothetical protein K458DRAFT_490884 [Lentithecium fluviatile CBS 122367]|uniref:Transcription factor TFIIIB component B'' Myb domain-containing protein n=1 Tax=Lentithecium fluviatile CBS 122367 TaxID=1168545 RepID=A0A6G1IL83_9PLEO|nr:hypothetical protein K458DRAFT_490884 [Lentithecium fluviatile CBS 122367]